MIRMLNIEDTILQGSGRYWPPLKNGDLLEGDVPARTNGPLFTYIRPANGKPFVFCLEKEWRDGPGGTAPCVEWRCYPAPAELRSHIHLSEETGRRS